eukprot:g32950.t1
MLVQRCRWGTAAWARSTRSCRSRSSSRRRLLIILGVLFLSNLRDLTFFTPGSPPTGERLSSELSTHAEGGTSQAVKEKDAEYLEQLKEDEDADRVGSPRPFFTLTEQWGLLGALVGLVVVFANVGGLDGSLLDAILDPFRLGGLDQAAMSAAEGAQTVAAGAEAAAETAEVGSMVEAAMSLALPGVLASLGSLAGLVVQGVQDQIGLGGCFVGDRSINDPKHGISGTLFTL